MRPRDPSDVGPDALFNFWVDEVDAVLSAEDDVVVTMRIGVSHFSVVADARGT